MLGLVEVTSVIILLESLLHTVLPSLTLSLPSQSCHRSQAARRNGKTTPLTLPIRRLFEICFFYHYQLLYQPLSLTGPFGLSQPTGP